MKNLWYFYKFKRKKCRKNIFLDIQANIEWNWFCKLVIDTFRETMRMTFINSNWFSYHIINSHISIIYFLPVYLFSGFTKKKLAKVCFDYTPNAEDELELHTGDVLEVLREVCSHYINFPYCMKDKNNLFEIILYLHTGIWVNYFGLICIYHTYQNIVLNILFNLS